MGIVDVTRKLAASPATLWALLENHEGYARWGPWIESTLDAEGSPTRNGVGAVRRLKADAKTVLLEEITGFEPPTRITYVLRSGLPLKSYRAEMTLSPEADGTSSLRIRSEFQPSIPGTGWLVERKMKQVYEDVAKRLEAYARGK